jgi:hypothetical protein
MNGKPSNNIFMQLRNRSQGLPHKIDKKFIRAKELEQRMVKIFDRPLEAVIKLFNVDLKQLRTYLEVSGMLSQTNKEQRKEIKEFIETSKKVSAHGRIKTSVILETEEIYSSAIDRINQMEIGNQSNQEVRTRVNRISHNFLSQIFTQRPDIKSIYDRLVGE